MAYSIAIVDYGMGNLASVQNSCRKVGFDAHIVRDTDALSSYDKIILPGVGAFPDAINRLAQTNLDDAIKQAAKTKPILGICLGLHLLFETGYEHQETHGLALLKGSVIRFDAEKIGAQRKVPHMGWNKLFVRKNSILFDNIATDPYLYFVHSFYVVPESADILCESDYGISFVSAIEHENICGIQPHPEKSGETGLHILQNFLEKK